MIGTVKSKIPAVPSPLSRKLSGTRSWWRVTRLVAGLGWTACVLALLLLVCYYADRRWTLSAPAREHWRLAIALTGGGVLLFSLLRIALRRLPDALLAAHVERRYPVLAERLLTTISLEAPAKTTAADPGFSRTLAASLAEETRQVASGLNFRRAVDLRPLRNALIASVLALSLLLGQSLATPRPFSIWMQRMLHPRADIAPFALTRVWIQPDAEILPQGAALALSVVTRGTPAEICRLRYHVAGTPAGEWKTAELREDKGTKKASTAPVEDQKSKNENEPEQRFRFRLPNVASSITMLAEANDGRSNERTVAVEPRPMLLNLRMTVRYPAYMRRAPRVLSESSGAISEPFGSEIDIEAVANKPLRRAEYIRNQAAMGTWAIRGERALGHLSVNKPGTYGLNLWDRHNFASAPTEGFPITVLRDATPTVTITRPAIEMDLVPDGSIPLVTRAQDDYGVNRLSLVYDTASDPSRIGKPIKIGRGSLALPGANGGPQAEARVRWNLASIRAQAGQVVRYEVDAVDNDNLDGPHTGRSQAYQIHVVSMLEMQGRMKQALDEEARTLALLRQHQIAAQKILQAARQKNDPAAISRAQEAQRAVAQETKALAERAAQTTAQLENNNLATQSELQRRDEAAQTLQNSANAKMPEAANAMQSAQTAPQKSADRSSELAQAEAKQNEIRKDIDRAQALLSRTPPPDQLAQEASRLAQEQRRLAGSARSLAEDIRARQQQSPNSGPTPEQKAGMEMEKRQQAQATEDTKRLEAQLAQAAKSAEERGQKAQADSLRRAAQALKAGQAQAQQAQAQNALNKNNPDNAARSQDKAANALEKAAEAAQRAASPDSQSPQATADRLEQTAQQLTELAQKQQELANATKQTPSGAQSKALAQQQRDLQKAAQAASKDLKSAAQAQQSMQSAQQQQSQASQSLSQNQPQAAQSPAQQAAQNLQKAAQQAQQAAQQIRQAQAAAEMAERVERLAQIQRGVQDATKRLEAAQKNGTGDENARRELRQAGEQQARLEQEAQDIAERFPSPAFQSAMKMAAKQMHPATEKLSGPQPDTGTATQAAQGRAAQTLDTVAQALKQQAKGGKPGGDQQQQQAGQQGQQGQPSASQAQQAAAMGDLTLAQGLQSQVQQDTKALEQARAANPNRALNADQKEQAGETTQTQQMAQSIAQRAASQLSPDPNSPISQQLAQAGQHMDASAQRLGQQQTDAPTQTHQEQALQSLAAASRQLQQQMQQQQQQQQQQQASAQGAPQPSQQKGNDPDKNAFRQMKTERGPLSNGDGRAGNFSNLSARAQRTMRESQNDPVPAEYRDLVKRYYKSLAEKKR